jgi:hypothetical protein
MALDGAVKSVNREVEAKARSLAEEIPMQQIGYFILFVREMCCPCRRGGATI